MDIHIISKLDTLVFQLIPLGAGLEIAGWKIDSCCKFFLIVSAETAD